MKKYEELVIEIITFECEDVITWSSGDGDIVLEPVQRFDDRYYE